MASDGRWLQCWEAQGRPFNGSNKVEVLKIQVNNSGLIKGSLQGYISPLGAPLPGLAAQEQAFHGALPQV